MIQVLNELIWATIGRVWVVECSFSFTQWQKQFFVHFCELESLPEISNADLVVTNICESEQGVVAFARNSDCSFFNVATNWLFDEALSSL